MTQTISGEVVSPFPNDTPHARELREQAAAEREHTAREDRQVDEALARAALIEAATAARAREACARAEAELSRVMAANAELFASSHELAHVAAFADSRRAGQWATLSGVLLRVVLAVPHQVVLPAIIGGEVSLNLFLALIGVSGGGKGTADKAAAEAFRLSVGTLERAAVRHPLLPIGTGEGINRTYARSSPHPVTGTPSVTFHQRAALFGCRDIATVAALTGRSGSTFVPELLKANMGEELGFANADRDRRVILPMHSYRLCLSAGVQPDNGAVLLNDQARTDGLPQRFLWVPVREGRARRGVAGSVDPATLVLPDYGVDPFALAEGDDDTLESPLVPLEVAGSIERLIVETDAAKDGDVFGRTADPLAGHRLLTQLKLAAAFAAMHGRTEVGEEDWSRAGQLAAVSAAALECVVAASVTAAERESTTRGQLDGVRQAAADETRSDRKLHRVRDRIHRHLADTGGWVSSGTISRLVTRGDRGHIDAALRSLCVTGEVEHQEREWQPGKRHQVYRARRDMAGDLR